MSQVFFEPSTNSVIDFVGDDGLSELMRQNLDQIRERRKTEIIVISSEEAVKRCCDAAVEAPSEITREQFIDWLECLPPVKWRRGINSESFMISEARTYNVRQICVRIGKRYFGMVDYDTLEHDEIVAKVRQTIPGV